jgi:hypothetical protein
MSPFVVPPSARPSQPVIPPPANQQTGSSSTPSDVTQYLHVEPDVVKLALQRNPGLQTYFNPNGTLKADKLPAWAKKLKAELKGQPVQTLVLYDKANPRLAFLYGHGPKQGQPLLKDGKPLTLRMVPPKTPLVGTGDYPFGGPESVQVLPAWSHPTAGTVLPGQSNNPMGIGSVGIALAENAQLNDGQVLPISEVSLHNWYPTSQGQAQINHWLQQNPRLPQSNGCFRASAEDVLGAMLILGNTPAENGLDTARLVDGYTGVLRRQPGVKTLDLMLVQSDMSHYDQVQVLPAHGQGRQVKPRASTRQLSIDSLATIKANLTKDLPAGTTIRWQTDALVSAKNQPTDKAIDVADVILP